MRLWVQILEPDTRCTFCKLILLKTPILKSRLCMGQEPRSSGNRGAHVKKVMGSNLCSVYWMDTLLCWKIVIFVRKDENDWKRGSGWHIKNILALRPHDARARDESLSIWISIGGFLISTNANYCQCYLKRSVVRSFRFFVWIPKA